MDFEGSGILALWNGADFARREEYNLWHSREHVPERLSVPGMRSARRYVRTSGGLPEYLTLYEVDDLSVLTSQPYRHLLETPTEWSGSMRPSFLGFLRKCCVRLVTEGGGLGSNLAVLPTDVKSDLSSPELRRAVKDMVTETSAITAAHIIQTDPSIPSVPFQIGGNLAAKDIGGALLFESYDSECLRSTLQQHQDQLSEMHLGSRLGETTFYDLAYALTTQSIDRIHPLTYADFRARNSQFQPGP